MTISFMDSRDPTPPKIDRSVNTERILNGPFPFGGTKRNVQFLSSVPSSQSEKSSQTVSERRHVPSSQQKCPGCFTSRWRLREGSKQDKKKGEISTFESRV